VFSRSTANSIPVPRRTAAVGRRLAAAAASRATMCDEALSVGLRHHVQHQQWPLVSSSNSSKITEDTGNPSVRLLM